MRSLLLTLLVCLSCSSDRRTLLNSWKGQNVAVLNRHPVFSQIPYKETELGAAEVERNYQEQGKYRTKASCQGLAGCLGLPSGACQNIFTIKNGRIKKYVMRESCLTDRAKLPDRLEK